MAGVLSQAASGRAASAAYAQRDGRMLLGARPGGRGCALRRADARAVARWRSAAAAAGGCVSPRRRRLLAAGIRLDGGAGALVERGASVRGAGWAWWCG